MTTLLEHLDKIKHLIPPATELSIDVLEGGYSNKVYCLSWQGRPRWVLRVPGLDADDFQISRISEKIALSDAQETQISPSCLYFEETSGLMVSQFVAQKAFDWQVEHTDYDLLRLAKSTQLIHKMSSNQAHYELDKIILGYLGACEKKLSKDDLLRQEVGFLQDLSFSYLKKIRPYSPVMCHNDINPKNCLADDLHFWVIDWEYAGMGDALFDIALIFSAHNFTPRQQALFLSHYDDTLDLNALSDDLVNYQVLYKMREMAWLLLKHISTPQDVEAIQCYHAFKQEVLEDIVRIKADRL